MTSGACARSPGGEQREGARRRADGVFGLVSATYRRRPIVSKLLPGGDLLDLWTDAPAYLLQRSPGPLNSAINVSDPQVRVKVKVFLDGGVLDVCRCSRMAAP